MRRQSPNPELPELDHGLTPWPYNATIEAFCMAVALQVELSDCIPFSVLWLVDRTFCTLLLLREAMSLSDSESRFSHGGGQFDGVRRRGMVYFWTHAP